MKIAILAGEMSGDILGAGLIAALQDRFPQARFEGVGGERMIAQGCHSRYPLEKLSVMGLTEVVRHLPELLRIRRALYRCFAADPPAVFIGIDAPDFNLPLERRLHARGIPTVHYVSPQVWAWRQGRVRKISRSVDLMLTLLPFEEAFYRRHAVPVRYVGHPLADEIPLQVDRRAARKTLGIPEAGPLLALLPGSRMGEAQRLGPLFIETARWLRARRPCLGFVIPAATAGIQRYLTEQLAAPGDDLPVMLVEGCSRLVMTAADVVLLASGTATLEALLLKRPMVVAYRVAPFTAWIAARLIKISRYSLPNLLAGRDLVSELIQADATAEKLGGAVLELLDNPAARARQVTEFSSIHQLLRRGASQQAAAAIAELLTQPPGTGG